MDKMLYIAASGAKQDLLATGVHANNLANVKTTGFRAQLEQARAMPAFGEGYPTRVFSMTESPSNNYEGGAMIQTGRNLDVAVQGDGWLSVQDDQGNEAYTRAGSLQMGPDGELLNSDGRPIIGDGGPVYLPIPVSNVNIAADGTISIRPQGAPENVSEAVAQLKLVKPQLSDLERGLDGLFRLKNGQDAQEDPTVRVSSGMVEGSNVNPISEMVDLMSLQRHYEMQVKFMKQVDDLSTRGNELMRII